MRRSFAQWPAFNDRNFMPPCMVTQPPILMQASEPCICTNPAPYVAQALARSGAGAVAPRPDDFVVGINKCT